MYLCWLQKCMMEEKNMDLELHADDQLAGDAPEMPVAETETHYSESDVPAEALEEEIESFEGESLERMAEILKNVIRDNRIMEFRKSFALLRNRYREIFEEEKTAVLATFLEEGGKAENFKFTAREQLGALKQLIQQYSDKLLDIRKNEEQQLQANLLAKQDIIDELKSLISNEQDIKKAFEKFNELKNRWSATGPVPAAHSQSLWNTYKHFTDTFYDFVKINKELFEMDLRKNLETKEQLIRRVEGLSRIPSIKKSIELLHNIQKEWRETGPVPKAKTQEIFQQFKDAVDKIYARRSEFIEEQKQSRDENLALKTALCEEAEKLSAPEYPRLTDWKKADTLFQALDEKWRSIGRVPEEFNDTIWARFKAARKELSRKRFDLLKGIHAEHEANYQAKEKLCIAAEKLSENENWKETSQKLIQLQQEWKKIGAVDRKRSDAIWGRFRAACDAFFQKKEGHFASQTEKETENLEAKKAILEEIKAFVPGEDLDSNLAAIRDKQKAFGAIGFVPIKHKAEMEKAFNDAVNEAFKKLNIDPEKKNRIEYKVRIEGMLQQENALNLLRDERTFVGNRIRKMEEEILQIENNLGFFKISKGAEGMMKQFEDKVTHLRQEMSQWEDKKILIRNAIRNLEGK